MNSTMFTADRATHLKIVVLALVAAIVVTAVGVSSRLTADDMTQVYASGPAVKASKVVTTARSDISVIR